MVVPGKWPPWQMYSYPSLLRVRAKAVCIPRRLITLYFHDLRKPGLVDMLQDIALVQYIYGLMSVKEDEQKVPV